MTKNDKTNAVKLFLLLIRVGSERARQISLLIMRHSFEITGPEVIKLFSCSTQLSMKF